MINKDIKEILISNEELDATVSRLAKEIDRDYSGEDKKLVLLCILKGSIVFMGDLMKKISVPLRLNVCVFPRTAQERYPAVMLTSFSTLQDLI